MLMLADHIKNCLLIFNIYKRDKFANIFYMKKTTF